MSADTFMSFAYGSNMSAARLRDRCPSATPVGAAELIGYGLRWHKRCTDGSCKCDILSIERPDARVFGVLYEIAAFEKELLDKHEGLGKGYEEIEVEVLCCGEAVSAKAYQANDIDATLKPYSWYHAFVIAGAKEHRLPEDYIADLESVVTLDDSNRERHEKNMNLIKDGPA